MLVDVVFFFYRVVGFRVFYLDIFDRDGGAYFAESVVAHAKDAMLLVD